MNFGKPPFGLRQLLIVLVLLPAAMQTVHVLGSRPVPASPNPQQSFNTKADKFLKMLYESTVHSRTATDQNKNQASRQEKDLESLAEFMSFRRRSGGGVDVSVAVELKGESLTELKNSGFPIGSQVENIATIETTVEKLPQLAAVSSVVRLSGSTSYELTNDRAARGIGVTTIGGTRVVSQTGAGVVVGIIDSGIDFRHVDFTRPGSNGLQTRIKALLDMTIYDPTIIVVNGTNVTIDANWNYTAPGGSLPIGRLYNESDINAALQVPKPANQNADLVKQRDKHGHGTHVAGTAAGNGLGAPSLPGLYAGMAPEADLVIVKATRSNTGVYSFFSNDQIASLAFIRDQAAILGEPFVINMSYGDHFSPHDGTQILAVAIDGLVNGGPGRAVCVAAGNSGNEDIHASGNVSSGGDVVINLVPPPGNNPGYLELYYSGSDRFSITVTKPNGTVIGPFAYDPGPYNNLTLGDPHINLYNTTDPHYDNKNNIFIGFTAASSNLGPSPWVFRLHGDSVATAGRFDAWIWRGGFTTQVDGSARLTTPGDSRGAITVGAWTSRGNPGSVNNHALFSSNGPTVDDRQKPDISAPGDYLYSSRSSDGTVLNFFYGSGADALAPGVASGSYGGLGGTSMSTPVVTGAVALMLQVNRNLTIDQIKDVIRTTATHDAFTGPSWSPYFGHGKLNVAAAIAAIPAATPTPTPTPGASPSPGPPPVLLTEEDSWRAVAVDSVSFVRDPFPLLTDHNFSSDRRTRIALFATNLNLATGEDMSVVTAQAEDQFQQVFPLTIEHVGRVSNVSEITQVNFRPPAEWAGGGDFWVSVSLRGVASNKVLISIKPQDINPTPPPRSGHALVYDPGRRAALLLNGDHNAPANQGEVWSWTGQRWLLIDTTGPAPRTLAAVAYDTGRRRLVMQGGLGTGTTVFGDTILWDGRQWQTAASVGPGIRNHQAMVYDAARGKLVLFGGQDGNINLVGDTWEWDGNVWTRVATTGPSPRVHHAMVYDSVRQKVLVFGGSNTQGDLADFWEWDGSSWHQIPTQGTWPSPRAAHRMAFHEAQGKVYLVGGFGVTDTVWTWNGSTWTRFLGATPPVRSHHALAYDAARNRLVLFGGFQNGNNVADTWELVDDRWLLVNPQ